MNENKTGLNEYIISKSILNIYQKFNNKKILDGVRITWPKRIKAI